MNYIKIQLNSCAAVTSDGAAMLHGHEAQTRAAHGNALPRCTHAEPSWSSLLLLGSPPSTMVYFRVPAPPTASESYDPKVTPGHRPWDSPRPSRQRSRD